MEVLTRFDNPVGHSFFRCLEVGTGIVDLFHPDFAIHFEHPVIILKHMLYDGAGESVPVSYTHLLANHRGYDHSPLG